MGLDKRIFLSPPHMGCEEERLVQEAFESNWISPLGPQVEAFEKEMAEYVGVNGALAVNSGTSALHLALRYLRVDQGDIVFCSTFSFVASANPIVYQGAVPVFIDSECESWNMSPSALARAFAHYERMGKLPKAVIVVNLFGQSADMSAILRICDQHGVPVVEDAAESLGATYHGKASGTFGKFGVYSFNGNKIITTSGGGMLVSDDREALTKMRFWASQSRDLAVHYQHSELGYNYRLSNVLAAIGRGQLGVLDKRISARRSIFQRYYLALSNLDGFMFMPELANSLPTRWLTALTVNPLYAGISSGEIIEALAEENIEARPVWKPLHLQPLFKDCKYFPHTQDKSISEQLFKDGLCLPSGSNLSEEDQDRVIKCILTVMNSRGTKK
ncbi:DegT/DnrJ/EryC1/StrS family aminotransferase [Paenibacillus eucommiae]|uniref:Pyridoxal phosphate-dependent aminotransferase EpsN n=1 Tax=Paenibacillus eucommiae TaxID=1355755 RepID=A0ABS4J6V3_9BACL|nr:DegT/DnrJ/EryC1/StrS family aminotransferase [Paenibacillus eucommiae]MBP1995569.1 pyridoxal phosphate-dependent aminotransferase EpsN [Paenibacillus eucommiae]